MSRTIKQRSDKGRAGIAADGWGSASIARSRLVCSYDASRRKAHR